MIAPSTASAPELHRKTRFRSPGVRAVNSASSAARLGERLMADLRAIQSPLVREVRGRGLMVGIELRQRVTPLLKALMEKGVLALPAGTTVLRLLPPLVIEEADLDTVVDTIAQVLAETEAEDR